MSARYVARNQLERLSALGYQLMSGFEAEFFMYRKDGGGDGGDVTTRPMFDGVDTQCNVIMAEHGELLCSMCDLLSAADIDVEAIHPESAPGQLEFATGCKFGIESADQMFRSVTFLLHIYPFPSPIAFTWFLLESSLPSILPSIINITVRHLTAY